MRIDERTLGFAELDLTMDCGVISKLQSVVTETGARLALTCIVNLKGNNEVIPHCTPIFDRHGSRLAIRNLELVGAIQRLVAAQPRVSDSSAYNARIRAARHVIVELLQKILLAVTNVVEVQDGVRPFADLFGALDVLSVENE